MHTGQVLAGEFVLQQLLFQDSTGEVWRALETNAGRLAVLRFVPVELRGDTDFLCELKRRAEAQKSFSYSHAVMIHRILNIAELGPVFVSKHTDGLFLKQYAAQWIDVQGRFPYNLLFDVFQPVANALDLARERGILHQSLTPQRIVVSQNEGVQVYDFELPALIRRYLATKQGNSKPAEPNLICYLPPEELDNYGPEPADSSCDQYALAMIIEELLLKRPVFDLQKGDLMTQIIEKQPPKLPNIPLHVNASLQRALQKNPKDRLQSCIQFLDALGGLIPVTMPVPTPYKKSVPSSRLSMKTQSSDRTPSAADSVASFEQISSDANKASAKKVAGKIKTERRWRQLFLFWNILILIACIVAVVCFRNHLSSVWRQRVQENSGETQEEQREERKKRRTYGSINKESSSLPRQRKKAEKELDFSGSNESSFENIQGLNPTDEVPDEVRFIGISQSGKKILFAIDASSTMGGESSTPWSYVYDELAHSFRDLNGTQFFQVVYYDDQAHRLDLDSQQNPWISASEQTKKEAYQFLKLYKPAGQANPLGAMEDAFSLNPDVVFLLSSQKSAKISPQDVDKIKKLAGRRSVNVIEIGDGQESPQPSSLQQLAKETRGEYRWIDGRLHGLKQ